MRKGCVFLLAIFLLVGLSSGKTPTAVEGKGFKVTLDDLRLLIRGMDEAPREKLLSDPFAAAKYLQFLAEVEVFSRLAIQEGLDKDPIVAKKIELSTKAILAKAYLEREVEKRVNELKITDKDIEEFYKANKERFKTDNGTYVPLKSVKDEIIRTIREIRRKSAVQELEEEAFKKFEVKFYPEVLRLLSKER